MTRMPYPSVGSKTDIGFNTALVGPVSVEVGL